MAPSPVEALRGIREAAQAQNRSNVFDIRWALLEDLIRVLESETIQAFSNVAPDDIMRRAEELGRGHWKRWGTAVELGRWMAEEIGVPANGPDFLGRWLARAERVHELFPNLPAKARLHYRATAFLMATLARGPLGEEAAKKRAADPTWPWSTAVGDVKPCVLSFFALIQALDVAGVGAPGRIADETVQAIAQELWRHTRSGADEEVVEDAYDAAAGEEALVDGGADDSVSLDDYLASIAQ